MSVPNSCAIWNRVRSSARRVSAKRAPILGKAGSCFLNATAAPSGSCRMLQPTSRLNVRGGFAALPANPCVANLAPLRRGFLQPEPRAAPASPLDLRQPVQLGLDLGADVRLQAVHLPAINPIQGDVAGAAERECEMGRNALAAGLVKVAGLTVGESGTHPPVHLGLREAKRLARHRQAGADRIFDTETDFAARRFIGGLPPRPEPSLLSIPLVRGWARTLGGKSSSSPHNLAPLRRGFSVA